jgi:peptidoglycan/LPS O-acetylase OafA/YrhL
MKSDAAVHGMKTGVLAKPSLPGLNILRVLATLYMVMYHLHPSFLPDALQRFFSAGSTDTSLFFILSGFLLAHLYAEKPMDAAGQLRFLRRRLSKILPANVVGLLFVLLAHRAFGHGVQDWGTVVQCLALVQAWTVGGAYSLNVPAWSMSCLLFFYLLFPVVLPRLQRLATPSLQLFMFAGWIGSALVVPVLAQWPGVFEASAWAGYLHNSPLPRSLEFMLGMGLAILVARKGMPPVWLVWLAVPVSVTVLVLTAGEVSGINNGVLAPFSICLLLAFANPGARLVRLGQSGVVETLSKASIGVFMLHMTWTQIFLGWVLPHWHLTWNWSTLALYLAAVIGSAVLANTYLCQPAAQLFSRRPRLALGWITRPTRFAAAAPQQ